jgi:hypothetical protein
MVQENWLSLIKAELPHIMAHRKRKLLAIERIQRFLSLWQDADSDIPIHRAGKDKRA